MGLWGASDSDESKPKHLTAAEKKEVFANTTGWEHHRVTIIQVPTQKY